MVPFIFIHKIPDSLALGMVIETLNSTPQHQDWIIQFALVVGHYTLKIGVIIPTNTKEE